MTKKLKTDGDARPAYEIGPDDIKARFLIDRRSMGTIIGKGGSRIKTMRDETGVYASILKVKNIAQESPDRVLVLQGTPDQVSDAMKIVSTNLISNTNERQDDKAVQTENTKITVLFDQTQAGAVIGKGGSTIKEFQSTTGAKMSVSKDVMPGSTERNAAIQGTADIIRECLKLVLLKLNEFPVTGSTTEYTPTPEGSSAPQTNPYAQQGMGFGQQMQMQQAGYPPYVYAQQGYEGYQQQQQQAYGGKPFSNGFPQAGVAGVGGVRGQQPSRGAAGGIKMLGGGGAAGISQQVMIPTASCGGVIGKGGRTIRNIQGSTGTTISIADPDPEKKHERLCTITGTQAGIDQAIALIQRAVESEASATSTPSVMSYGSY